MTLDRNTKKLAPIISMLGFGGGGAGLSIKQGTPLELSPFKAEGGSKTGPSGGYFYHVFTTPGTFTITRGTGSNIEVMVLGGGASGRFGPGSPGNGGAGGGGGGGIRVHNLGNNLTPASYNVEVGSGGDNQLNTGTGPYYGTAFGDDTVFGNPSSLGLPPSTHPFNAYIVAGGGSAGGPLPWDPGYGGPSGAAYNFPTGSAVYTATGGQGGAGAPGGPPTAPLYAGGGGNAGGYPMPPSNWWRPYISPGQGGAGKSLPYSSVYGAADPGQPYGGGGGGAGGLIPYGEQYPNTPAYAPTPSGPPTTYPYIGTGAPGICVVRYPDTI